MIRFVDIRPAAERDIRDHADYIAVYSVDSALRFLDNFYETANKLRDMPEMGRLRVSSKPRLGAVCFFPVKGFRRYLIFYRALSDGVSIIRVLHSSRDINKILSL